MSPLRSDYEGLEKEECRGLKTYVSLLDAKSEQVMVTTIFPPRPLDVNNEEGFGFSVSKQALSEAWESEAGEYCDKLRVEITKPYMKSLLPCEEPSRYDLLLCYSPFFRHI